MLCCDNIGILFYYNSGIILMTQGWGINIYIWCFRAAPSLQNYFLFKVYLIWRLLSRRTHMVLWYNFCWYIISAYSIYVIYLSTSFGGVSIAPEKCHIYHSAREVTLMEIWKNGKNGAVYPSYYSYCWHGEAICWSISSHAFDLVLTDYFNLRMKSAIRNMQTWICISNMTSCCGSSFKFNFETFYRGYKGRPLITCSNIKWMIMM